MRTCASFGCLLTAMAAWAVCAMAGPNDDIDALAPHPAIQPVPDYLQDHARRFQSAPSITVSPGGRLWVVWHTGDTTEGDENGCLVISSGDGGRTWSRPLLALDIKGPLRMLDPGFWTAPDGRVWLFYGQLYGFWDGRCGLWATQPENAEDEHTRWTAPRRLCHGYMKNKPLVLSDGKWLLPVEFMNARATGGRLGAFTYDLDRRVVFSHPELNAANVFVSTDQGRTVQRLGQAQVPPRDRSFYEHMLAERKDGSLWMLVRTRYGIGESFSTDRGRTWTAVAPAKIQNADARFFLGRLRSGNLLLVKNGPVDQRYGRSHIMAYVSADDGRTWTGGLVLDERKNVSYPDVAQDRNGVIYVVHDRERTGAKEIVFHRLTEADVRAGRLVSPQSALKIVANRATGK
jgi:predicted neuraminidase